MMNAQQIVKALDQTVVGQSAAKKALAVAAQRFQRSVRMHDAGLKALKPTPVLLVGRSGHGKTHLITELSKLLDVPYHRFDASELVSAGFAGLHPKGITRTVLESADYDVRRAERSIIHLDELDKILERGGGGFDVGGVPAQQSILSMLEGITHVHSRKQFHTGRCLFLLSGHFGKPSTRRQAWTEYGKGCLLPYQEAPGFKLPYGTIYENPRHIPAKWFLQRGMIPELIARIPERVALMPLTRADYRRILFCGEDSPLEELKRAYEIEGVKLEFHPTAIDALVRLAMAEPTGARALYSVCNERLRVLEMLLADLSGVSRVIVDHETILADAPPLMERGQPTPRSVNLRPFRDILRTNTPR